MNRAWHKSGKILEFEVDEAGTTQIRYDVFEQLLKDAGWQWIPDGTLDLFMKKTVDAN